MAIVKKKGFKQDINFLERPMWAVSRGLFKERHLSRSDNSNKTYQIFIYEQNDFSIETTMGAPVLFDGIVLMYLLKEIQKGSSTKIENLTYYKILKECGFSTTKTYYKKLEKSLDMWSTTTLRFYNNSFLVRHKKDNPESKNRSKFQNTYKTINFSPIDTWGMDEDDSGKKTLFVRMGEEFVNAITASNYYKYIEFDEYRKFSSPLAARLNEVLMKNFFHENFWKINIMLLAEKLTLAEKYPSKIIEKLKPALNQVNKNTSREYTMEKKENNIIIFTLAPSKKLKIPPEITALIPEDQRENCVDICFKILNKQDLESLTYYVTKTKKMDAVEKRESWGATIQDMYKRQDYEKHIAALDEQKKKHEDDQKKTNDIGVTVAEKAKAAEEERNFRRKCVADMPEDEYQKFEEWIRAKKKISLSTEIKTGAKLTYILPFWEDINKSEPWKKEEKEERGLFD